MGPGQLATARGVPLVAHHIRHSPGGNREPSGTVPETSRPRPAASRFRGERPKRALRESQRESAPCVYG